MGAAGSGVPLGVGCFWEWGLMGVEELLGKVGCFWE